MENKDEVLLPTGDYLRQLLGQSKVKDKELKEFLRNRGVFTGSSKKDHIGPILIKTGMSPDEYIDLRDTYRTKEESTKSKSRSINWQSEKNLIESIPNEIDYESLLNDAFGVYQLSNTSGFTAASGNPDHIYMDFEITRNDAIQNWGESSSKHKGRVEFKKDAKTKVVSISMTHTAPETKAYANKVTDNLVRHFKDTGHIDQEEKIKTIKFNDFTNENRVKFMNELTQKVSYSFIDFLDTKDIHFSPDNLISNPPSDIVWMKDKIEDLKIKGKGLHSTFFVQETKFHPFIQIFGLTCEYSFATRLYSGSCRILFEFSDKDETNQNSELTLNITMLKLDLNDSGEPKSKVKKDIIDSLEKFKMEAYDKFKQS
ncbi:GapS4b family protein [Endozoicomonas numazuensis]|uniref:GAPS4b N-terminal domain-containing protein n=1 Tax=Endozoicomonas numazuensis TaxID=1137799 RepID=A0A081NI06_9GAMM|nr:hypothetical protein [Endozoicomonas numazuensis]KEQ18079.1 hypothetical protein GZ78_10915 [Endozoicomonas numazuensis]